MTDLIEVDLTPDALREAVDAVPEPPSQAPDSFEEEVRQRRKRAHAALFELRAYHPTDRLAEHISAVADYVLMLEMMVAAAPVVKAAEAAAARGDAEGQDTTVQTQLAAIPAVGTSEAVPAVEQASLPRGEAMPDGDVPFPPAPSSSPDPIATPSAPATVRRNRGK
jgi:hypothetical protein